MIEVAALRWRHSNTWWYDPEAAGPVTRLPRAHHLHFTHGALPSLFYQDPNVVLGWLAKPDSMEFLVDLWGNVGKRVLEVGLGEILSPEGLSSELITRETFHGAIIHLPPPLEVGETIFLLLAVPPADVAPEGTQPHWDIPAYPRMA